MSAGELPDRRGTRTRVAVTITFAVLAVVAVVGVGAAALSWWLNRDPAPVVRTRTEQIGSTTVIVVFRDTPVSALDALTSPQVRWLLVALVASFVPAALVAWLVSGRLLREVDEALEQVEAAEADRQRRLQEVVHELRTPLAVVGTNLELASTTPELDPEAAGFVDASRRAVERMKRTVDDLAGHGRLAVKEGGAPVDLAAEARAVVAEHAGPAHVRGLAVVALPAQGLAVAPGDRGALRTAAGNLVSNAVRLAPQGSTIRVSCGGDADWAWLAVADEGPGIAPRDQPRVFERHWQGRHDAGRTAPDPTRPRGLGLTIARQLIEAQGGAVTVSSVEGAGSVFALWLPRHPGAERSAVVAPDGVHPARLLPPVPAPSA